MLSPFAEEVVLIFDGTCVLCNSFFQWIIKKDKDQIFRFTTIQSEVGQSLILSERRLQGIDSIILVSNGRSYTYSSAALRAMIILGGWPSWLGQMGLLFPKFIRDTCYRWIAKNRYKWFGQQACMIPDKSIRSRFLIDADYTNNNIKVNINPATTK